MNQVITITKLADLNAVFGATHAKKVWAHIKDATHSTQRPLWNGTIIADGLPLP